MEIEVKAKLVNPEKVLSALENMGCVLNDPVTQDDFIYNVKGVDLSSHSHGTPVLRIRKQKGRTVFTLKKNRSNDLDCIEKEVEVSDPKELEEIIKLLGFEKTVEVHKDRRKGTYKDYEVCFDEVKELGHFIEVEKISEEDAEKIQKEMFDFLKQLGVRDEDRVLIGYDSLVWLKNNNKGTK